MDFLVMPDYTFPEKNTFVNIVEFYLLIFMLFYPVSMCGYSLKALQNTCQV